MAIIETNYKSTYSEPFGQNTMQEMERNAQTISTALARRGEGSADVDVTRELKLLFLWRNSIISWMSRTVHAEHTQLERVLIKMRVEESKLQSHLERAAIAYAIMNDGLFDDERVNDDNCRFARIDTVNRLHCAYDFEMHRKGNVRPSKIFALLDPSENFNSHVITVVTEPIVLAQHIDEYLKKTGLIEIILKADKHRKISRPEGVDILPVTIEELLFMFGLIGDDNFDEEDSKFAVLKEFRALLVPVITKNGKQQLYFESTPYLQLRTLFNYLGAYDDLVRMKSNALPHETPQIIFVSVTANEPIEKFRTNLMLKRTVEDNFGHQTDSLEDIVRTEISF